MECPTNPPSNITQLCGGFGLQMRKTTGYFDMKWPDTLKMWQQNRFYCEDMAMPDGEIGLLPYTSERIIMLPWWNPKLTKAEME